MRRLEIGPGNERLPGFETLNAVATPWTDHVADARKLPFPDATFGEVYSCHCIEHIDWHDVEATIAEWARVLVSGGWLEVHTVNAAPLMRAMLEWEETGETSRDAGKWQDKLHKGDPFLSAQGRILNYAKAGPGGEFHRHRAILTPRYLRQCFERAGLVGLTDDVVPKGRKNHKAVNMGLRGRKA